MIQSRPIWDYYQPEFYKFNSDSIFLSKYILKNVDEWKNQNNISLLDLCCGCGVIGLEILQGFDIFDRAHFVELQKEFLDHLNKNLSLLNRKIEKKVFVDSYKHFAEVQNEKYQLIVSNPPYYEPLSGRLSENTQRAKCRFHMQGNFILFIESIKKLLSPSGTAYFIYDPKLSSCQLSNWLEELNDVGENVYEIVLKDTFKYSVLLSLRLL